LSLSSDRLERLVGVSEVLYLSDLAVAKDECLRPFRTASVARSPRERDRSGIVSRLEVVELVVGLTRPPSRLDS